MGEGEKENLPFPLSPLPPFLIFSVGTDEMTADLINVRQRIKELSVEELCQTAEDYFRGFESWDYHLAKPF